MNSTVKQCVIDLEMNGTSMWNDTIICLSALDTENPKEIITFHADKSEEELLIQFLKFFNAHRFQNVIGYNVFYDHQVVVTHAIKHRLPVGAFYDVQLTDLMLILKGRRFTYNQVGSLNEWSKFLLNKEKMQTEDSVPALWRQGKLDQISLYNKQDVELAYQIWKRLHECIGGYNQVVRHGVKQ